ncbi:hypothetical protein GCM10010341_53060 [Streptomyces noursei]|nr:hypothetical protein GCM10010341_53060 [Streptomyces noursei]
MASDPDDRAGVSCIPNRNRRARHAMAVLRRPARRFPGDRDPLGFIGEPVALGEGFTELWTAHLAGDERGHDRGICGRRPVIAGTRSGPLLRLDSPSRPTAGALSQVARR